MRARAIDCEPLRQILTGILLAADFRQATFGGPLRGNVASRWVRIVIRPVELRGQAYFQFSYFDAKKDVTKNFRGSEIEAKLAEILALGFAGVHVATASEEVDIRTTKKGKVLIGRRKPVSSAPEPVQPHNRIKDVPLPEGQANRLLEAMGILTRTGQVRPTMRAKYTQINEFLKQLTHVLDDAGLADLGRAVEILDCGCGSSFLTLAVHHYLNDVLRMPAHIMGVDVNEEVIRKSMARSERLGSEGLAFSCRPIVASLGKPDVVLALHACDTATDDAIAQAIGSEARLLLSVPCCHHHLNDQLRPEGPAQVLRPLLRHGILQQRTADLVTDALRALVLRIMGYRTDVVEFISSEHTARNVMIRAVRGAPTGNVGLVREYLEMCRFWGVRPYLEGAVGEPLQRLLGHPS